MYFLSEDISDDLSELASETVPDEVRKWLASTFAKQEQVKISKIVWKVIT